MEIEFYKSSLCPRCRMAAHALNKIQEIFPNLEVKPIEVTTNPFITLHAGIRMIPAIKINDKILSGLFLSQGKMQDFIAAQINAQSALNQD